MRLSHTLFAGCLVLLPIAQASAQTCGPKPAALVATGPNIFSEQQEQWLGDASADMVEAFNRPVRDPAESAYLQRIGNRLLAVLPPTSIQFRLLLVDSPEINGFSLAGGRIYITRKLVANANSEDEVASVIAHEMGHIMAHQIAVETSADLMRLMNVSEVSDRQDVYAKFQQLMDRRMREKKGRNPDADDKQDQADRIAVYATGAAGYRPQAYSEFWDRSFFVGGKTGNGFLDFLGATTPTQKRLRLMKAMIAELPAGCGGAGTTDKDAFTQWRKLVLANQSAASAATAFAGVKLTPHLRLAIDRLRFSPDGKFVLAQDESSIFVLSREPFVELFRIEADRANDAHFTPDSKGITFSTRTLHTEHWSIATHDLVAVHEVNAAQPCIDSFLTPDGRTLVCIHFGDSGNRFTLNLLDVETGRSLYEQRSWFEPTSQAATLLVTNAILERRSNLLPRAFSPDGKRLLLGPADAKLGFDLETRTLLKVGADLLERVDGAYAFVGNDVLGINPQRPKESGLFTFPEGKLIRHMELNFGEIESVANGHVVLVRSLKDMPVAAANLDSGMLISKSSTPAMDIFGDAMVAESATGSLQIISREPSLHLVGRTDLTFSPLGQTQADAISPDGRYLALSTRSRGGIWDLKTGQRLMPLKAFRSSVWKGGKLYTAFPNENKEIKLLTLVEIDPVTSQVRKLTDDATSDRRVYQGNTYEWRTLTGKAAQLVARSAADNSQMWTKDFPAGRQPYTLSVGSGDVLQMNKAATTAASAIIVGVPALAAQWKAIEHKETALLITDLAAGNGAVRRYVVLEAPVGFNNVDDLNRVGDQIYLTLGALNRTTVYSMNTGKQLRQFFGGMLAADEATGRIVSGNRRDELTIAAADGKELKHVSLGSPIKTVEFLNEGTELLVLTADQQVRRFAVQGPNAGGI